MNFLTYSLIFIAGYIIRHLIGIAFKRIFQKRMPDLFGGTNIFVNQKDVKEIVMSYDNGRTWYVRTKSGWAKVNHDFIRKILDINASDNPTTNNPSSYQTVS